MSALVVKISLNFEEILSKKNRNALFQAFKITENRGRRHISTSVIYRMTTVQIKAGKTDDHVPLTCSGY